MAQPWTEGTRTPPPRRVVWGRSIRTELVTPEVIEARRETARALIAGWNDGPLVLRDLRTVEPLQVSTKASVFRVASPHGSAVMKIHADEEAYTRECLAYLLLADRRPSPIPALLGRDDDARLLVLEDVAERAEVASGAELTEAAACLGCVHAAARDRAAMRETFGPLTLAVHRASLDEADWADAAAAARAVDLLIADCGADHIPVVIGDLKLGHYRRRADGSSVLLDLETFSVGVPEVVDLLSLLDLTEPAYVPSRDDWIVALRAYLRARGDAHAAERRAFTYFEAVSLTAKGVGVAPSMP